MKKLLIDYGANPPQLDKKSDIICDPKVFSNAAFQSGREPSKPTAPSLPSSNYQPLPTSNPLFNSSSPKQTKPSKSWWSFFCCGCGGDALEDNENTLTKKYRV